MLKVFQRSIRVAAMAAAIGAMALPALADTLVLKNGNRVSGYYEGGTSRVIRFRTDTGVQEYDLLTVDQIQFGGDVVSSTPRLEEPPAVTRTEPAVTRADSTSSSSTGTPRLQTREESSQPPVAANAANTAWTVPAGSTLVVRINSALDSERSEIGETFNASLVEPLVVQGIEVAPVGSQVRGRIAQVNEAGRVRGAAELRLELDRITVNGVPYALATNEYQEVAESRGGESARRIGIGAGLGAAIGAIAGGAQGAAIGAGIGGGTAGAVQVLTRGERINIPAETLLGFSLSEPLVIAGR